MYDYGSAKANFEHYNQTVPPLYFANQVNVPVALYWSSKDWLADPTDVNYLRKTLPNIVDDYELVNWDHLDFIWAINANDYLYQRMIQLMKSYL